MKEVGSVAERQGVWRSESAQWIIPQEHFLNMGEGDRKSAVLRTLRALQPRLDAAKRILNIGSAGTSTVYFYDEEILDKITSMDICAQTLVRDQVAGRVVADAESGLPFKDNAFDVVVSFYVARYITNIDHLIKDSMRVLRPGGMFLMMDQETVQHPSEVRRFNPAELVGSFGASTAQISFSELIPARIVRRSDEDFAHGSLYSLYAVKDDNYMRKAS